MPIVALIRDENAARIVLPWASATATARGTTLTVVCWTYAPLASAELTEPEAHDLVRVAQDFFSQTESLPQPEIIQFSGPSDSSAGIEVARRKDAELIVAAAADPTAAQGATESTNRLLRQSPCNTLVLFGDATRSTAPHRLFVAASDNSNDGTALYLASCLAHTHHGHVTLARAELETEQKGLEIGRRELQHLIRDSGVDDDKRLACQVFETGQYEEIAAAMDKHDIVFLGANSRLVPVFLQLTNKPTLAVIQRAPPLRLWRKTKDAAHWKPRLSPADYAELIQGLRHGSRLSADFITMLSLAAIVASVGLLQDSPAVVIGSMLLAPLMTPMIGCGLALAQANRTLGNTALRTVAVGLLCTLVISLFIGRIAPGAELTPQIYARGTPTALDLVVAVASAAAAAYALARPNLVGSIAGVAIATALVPPLCSVGLSVAYGDTHNALGASLLFVTNFLAIVLSAAVTFRLIGITATNAGLREKFWVARIAALLVFGTLAICVPLQQALLRSVAERKPQPRAYPMAKSVLDALEEHLESEPGVKLITAGRPSSHLVSADVVLVLGAAGQLDPAFAESLAKIVRQKMNDDLLVVDVHCIQEQWQKTPP